MKSWTNLLAGLIVGVVTGVAVLVYAAPDPAAPGLTRIGVVNFKKLIEGYDKMADQKAYIKTKGEGIRKEIDDRRKKLIEMRKKLQMHRPGSAAYNETNRKMSDVETQLRLFVDGKQKELNRLQIDAVVSVWNDVEKAAGKYARENGLSMVVKSNEIQFRVQRIEELDAMVTIKHYLYVDPKYDITDKVTAALNRQYRLTRDK